MADWFERLFRAFIEFKPARNWKCRFHAEDHYQDEIRVDGNRRVSRWYLHDNLIAELKVLEFPIYELYLTDAGYFTPTTLSRLNGIIWLFNLKLGIDLGVRFKLKYSDAYGRGRPLYTYIIHYPSGREYDINYITIQFDALAHEILTVNLPRDREIKHFMNHKELLSIRRIYYKLMEIVSELRKIGNKLCRDYMDCENPILSQISDFIREVYDFEDYFGLPHGIYARFDPEAVKNVLRGLIKEGEAMLPKARETLTEVMLMDA